MRRYTDITGQRLGRLLAVGRVRLPGSYRHAWVLQCDCGVVTYQTLGQIRQHKATSCGCDRPQRLAPAPPPLPVNAPVDTRVGRKVREARMRAGITQRQLAHALGLGLHRVANVKRGAHPIRVEMLVRIASVLGADPAGILGAALS